MKTLAIIRGAIAVLAIALIAGCANNPASKLPKVVSDRMDDYRLSTGDTVRVVVFGQDNVPTDYIVDDHGTISFPLAGSIKAAGLTTAELEKKISTGLKGALVDPNVSAQVLVPRPIYVLGAVTKPGSYPYTKNMTVLNAIAVGGGLTQTAYDDYFGITRDENGVRKEYRGTRNDYIYPEDVVYVYSMY